VSLSAYLELLQTGNRDPEAGSIMIATLPGYLFRALLELAILSSISLSVLVLTERMSFFEFWIHTYLLLFWLKFHRINNGLHCITCANNFLFRMIHWKHQPMVLKKTTSSQTNKWTLKGKPNITRQGKEVSMMNGVQS
jgi:hypothetical protein